MADKITETNEAKIEAAFYDGDTRTLTVDNPKDDLDANKIKSFATVAKTTQAIIGDKGSAAFVGINSARVVKKKTTQLDLA